MSLGTKMKKRKKKKKKTLGPTSKPPYSLATNYVNNPFMNYYSLESLDT